MMLKLVTLALALLGSGHCIQSLSLDNELIAFLSYGDVNSLPAFEEAATIIKTKIATTSNLQDAAVNLINTCKLMTTQDHASVAKKDAAKQNYAIRSTAHELNSAKMKIPKACDLFCDRQPQASWYSYPSAPDPNDLNDPATSASRAECIKNLYSTSQTWNSYENAMQDARTLCEAASIENAPAILNTMLDELYGAIPPAVKVIQESTSFASHMMSEQQAQHKSQMEENDQVYQDHLERVRAKITEANNLMSSVAISVKDAFAVQEASLVVVGAQVGEVSESTNAIALNMQTLHNTISLYASEYAAIFGRLAENATALTSHLSAQRTEEQKWWQGMQAQVDNTLAIIHQSTQKVVVLQEKSFETASRSLVLSKENANVVSAMYAQLGVIAPIYGAMIRCWSWIFVTALALCLVATRGIWQPFALQTWHLCRSVLAFLPKPQSRQGAHLVRFVGPEMLASSKPPSLGYQRFTRASTVQPEQLRVGAGSMRRQFV